MKVVLFCGGLGMRMRDYSHRIPKPMVPLRGMPILEHIMRFYAAQGHDEFILCTGWKGEKIEQYFKKRRFNGWKIHVHDTGVNATIGDRLRLAKEYVKDDEMFLATYGDGLTDCRVKNVVALNERRKSVVTFVMAKPSNSFHFVRTDKRGVVTGLFSTVQHWMNGGYFVLRPEIFDYLEPGGEIVGETNSAFAALIPQGKVSAFKHDGFWQAMDTFKDVAELEKLCSSLDQPAPWEIAGYPSMEASHERRLKKQLAEPVTPLAP